MDGRLAVERNRVALVRIVAALAAMAGFALGPGGPRDASARKAEGEPRRTLPRYLWRAVLRLLRPAESAARRLVIAAARGIVVTPPPPRSAWSPSPASQGRNLGRGRSQRGSSPVYGGGGAAGDGGGVFAPASSRRIALPLFDRLRRVGPRPLASRDLPRISVPGWTARLPVPVRHEPSPDDPISAARLALRLDALARALDDLPRQARRFARWQASRDAIHPTTARTARISPLRRGRPPGARMARSGRTATHRPREIDDILAHAHELALYALEHPDTS